MESKKKINLQGIAIFIITTFFFLEIGAKLFWYFYLDVPIFEPTVVNQAIHYAYYPNLKAVKEANISKEDLNFDILVLGGSVVNDWYGNIGKEFEEKLSQKWKQDIRVHNVSFPGHMTLDSYNKYKQLKEKDFDLVILYHGINDVPANNAPSSVFKNNYSHYPWHDGYRNLTQSLSNPVQWLVLPYTIKFSVAKIRERVPLPGYIPRFDVSAQRKWYKFGEEVKTRIPFEKNISNIIKLAAKKKEPVLLMTFAFYVPDDYSLERFQGKTLDYFTSSESIEFTPSPIEVWGIPSNVQKAIEIHNKITKQVALEFDNVIFVDQEKEIPKEGLYFYDMCHFSKAGIEKFVDNMVHGIQQRMMFDQGTHLFRGKLI